MKAYISIVVIAVGLSIATASPASKAVSTCKSNGKCFAFVTGYQLSWRNAEAHCENNFHPNGHLASLHMPADSSALRSFLFFATTDLWVGGYDFGHQPYRYTDETPFDYQPWAPGQPNMTSGCVQICHTTTNASCPQGNLTATDCDQQAQFVCEYGPIQPRQNSSIAPIKLAGPVCVPNSNRCFTLYKAYNDWFQADSFCDRSYTSLASARNVLDNTLLDTLVSYPNDYGNDIWLGGIRIDAGTGWQWSDGSPFGYAQWANNQPNATGPACVKVCRSNQPPCQMNKWVAMACDSTLLSFICESGSRGNSTFMPEPAGIEWEGSSR